MAFPATHAKRDAIVLQASRGFASAPNSPRVFLQSGGLNKRADIMQLIRQADKPGCPDVEAMLQRICSLFPTAREYDVKELMIKYHYREAVVVSALQVLKYPLTMPGPASVATPPMRHLPPTFYVPSSLHAWSETTSDGRNSKLGGAFSTTSNTPLHSPLPSRPHHSQYILSSPILIAEATGRKSQFDLDLSLIETRGRWLIMLNEKRKKAYYYTFSRKSRKRASSMATDYFI